MITLILLGMYAEYEEHKNNKPKIELMKKTNEKQLLLKSLDVKSQLIKDNEEKIKQINYKINKLSIQYLNYNLNLNNFEENFEEEYKNLKQNIKNINDDELNLIDKIKLHSFKINYFNKDDITKITRDEFKKIIDTLPKLIEFIKLTDFKYYNLKLPFDISTILFGCDSFKFWNIYWFNDYSKNECDKKLEQSKNLDIFDVRHTDMEFIMHFHSYIDSYNECLKYVEEYYKQNDYKQNDYFDDIIITIINNYINEIKKLIILYETKAEYLLNTGEIGIYINKILDDDKKNIYNQNNFDKLNQFKLNIEDKLNKTQNEIKEQVNKTTELKMKIEQFESDIYSDININKIKLKIINEYKTIKSDIDKTINYVLMIYEQSIINNKILLLQIENCFELKNKYELNTEQKELKNKMIVINNEIKDLQDYIECKRLENIYGTL